MKLNSKTSQMPPFVFVLGSVTLFVALVSSLSPADAALIAEPTHIHVHEPTLAKVGEIIEHVPTAVSHQSSTIVHSKEQRVTPVLAPVVRSYTAPLMRAYAPGSHVLHAGLPSWTTGPAAYLHVQTHAHAMPTFYFAAPARTASSYGNFAAYPGGTPFIYAASGAAYRH